MSIIGIGQLFNKDVEKRYALSFDGVDDYVDLGNAPATMPTGPFSLEVRFNLRRWGGLNGWEWIVAKNGDSNPKVGYVIGKSGARSQLWCGVGSGETSHVVMSSQTTIQTDREYHVVFTVNPGEGRLSLYIDGIFESEETFAPFVVEHDTRSLALGKTRYFNSVPIDGVISLFRMYHKELSAEEVANNYAGAITRSGLVGDFPCNEGGGNVLHDYARGIGDGEIIGATWVEV